MAAPCAVPVLPAPPLPPPPAVPKSHPGFPPLPPWPPPVRRRCPQSRHLQYRCCRRHRCRHPRLCPRATRDSRRCRRGRRQSLASSYQAVGIWPQTPRSPPPDPVPFPPYQPKADPRPARRGCDPWLRPIRLSGFGPKPHGARLRIQCHFRPTSRRLATGPRAPVRTRRAPARRALFAGHRVTGLDLLDMF